MLLGKRPRAPMRRTASMAGITVDPSLTTEPSDQNRQMMIIGDDFDHDGPTTEEHHSSSSNNNNNKEMMTMTMMMMDGNYNSYEDPRFLATMVSPRNYYRRNPSGDFANHHEPAHFLRTCGLCTRRLAPGKDIYMYRGDTAFCSLECREKQMKQDERKEKCNASPSTTSSSSSTTKSETMVAA